MKRLDSQASRHRAAARQARWAAGPVGAMVVALAWVAALPSPLRAQASAQASAQAPALANAAAGAGRAPVAAAPAAVAVAASAGAPMLTLQPLQWLAGCWQSELDEAGSGEQWMAAAGGTMLGMARTLKGGRVVQFEFMQIRESALGLVFIAHPSAQAGTRFAAVEISATAAVFEQRGPGFPQRVAYHLLPDGRLAGRIEGLRHGELRWVDFPMRRAVCDGPAAAPPGSGRGGQGG